MFKPLVLALVTAAGMLVGGAADAGGHVSWSVGINVPVVGAVISNAPVYYGRAYEPVYEPVYAPQPVYLPQPVYVPAPPVYRVPPPVVYYPAPVASRYYQPVPVVYGYGYADDYKRGWKREHRHWQERGERHEGRWNDRDHDHDHRR
jgi:hypothetical protein